MISYILYTYRSASGQEICHAYGPTDQATGQAEGQRLQGETPGLGFMVLPLEAISPTTVATVPAATATPKESPVSDSNPFDPEPSSPPAGERAALAAPQDRQDAPPPAGDPQEGSSGSGAENAPAVEAAGTDPASPGDAAEPGKDATSDNQEEEGMPPTFPRNRFLEAGASAEEADALEAQFDLAAPQQQEGMAETWAGMAQGDLSELLEHYREAHAAAADDENAEPPAASADTSAGSKTASPTVAADGGAGKTAGPDGSQGSSSTS